ncbi:MAG TPA: hypothetical protein VKT29_00760, partial [Terriglobales bacterium]|nr:hypothetical protein [Terriglobales bacterium]
MAYRVEFTSLPMAKNSSDKSQAKSGSRSRYAVAGGREQTRIAEKTAVKEAVAPKSQATNGAGKRLVSEKAERFTESVIREMTRQAQLYGAMNLAQGFPDFAAPAELKRAAQQAIQDDVNQYAITWGAKNLRQAIA